MYCLKLKASRGGKGATGCGLERVFESKILCKYLSGSSVLAGIYCSKKYGPLHLTIDGPIKRPHRLMRLFFVVQVAGKNHCAFAHASILRSKISSGRAPSISKAS